MTILSATKWANNSELIADCRKLGYLGDSHLTLDATYGKGNFYKKYRPTKLIAGDRFTPAPIRMSFMSLPFADKTFGRVVYDPPYKLNGRPDEFVDAPYGVQTYMPWQERMRIMVMGMYECCRVTARKGLLLAKCMDQVVSGQVRFQTDMLTKVAVDCGFRKVDELLFLRQPREQPHLRQVHSSRNYSVLMVFERLS